MRKRSVSSGEQEQPRAGLQADSLLSGLAVMLGITVIQRAVGLYRGVSFCRLLDAETLGQWAMAFGFVSLVTPMLLLGVPGSLPRYVEAFRQKGHLRPFMLRIVGLTGFLVTLAVSLIWIVPGPVGWLVFREPSDQSLVRAVGIAVLAVVIFNTLNELIAALRQVRVVSAMQFIQSVAFTLIGLIWLSRGGGLAGLVLSFAFATLLGTAPGWWVLMRHWGSMPTSSEPIEAVAMWKRLVPYAAALWVMNLLSNTFELSDRYMILHFSGENPAVGQGMVGEYHSACIIPALLLSVGLMIGGVVMPYLTADWEAGKRDAVGERLRQMLLGLSVLFTAGAAVALWLAPTLFQWLFAGRYTAGLSVMPLAFVFCIWASLGCIAQNYLWVVERGKLVGMALAVGLLANLALNYVLMPRYGLPGAVSATMLANGIVLGGIWWSMHLTGFRLDRSTLWSTLLPMTLLAGSTAAIVATIGCLLTSQHARVWLRQGLDEFESRRLRRLIDSP